MLQLLTTEVSTGSLAWWKIWWRGVWSIPWAALRVHVGSERSRSTRFKGSRWKERKATRRMASSGHVWPGRVHVKSHGKRWLPGERRRIGTSTHESVRSLVGGHLGLGSEAKPTGTLFFFGGGIDNRLNHHMSGYSQKRNTALHADSLQATARRAGITWPRALPVDIRWLTSIFIKTIVYHVSAALVEPRAILE